MKRKNKDILKITNEMKNIAEKLEKDAKEFFVSKDIATNYITLFYIATEYIREWSNKLKKLA